MLIQNAHSLHVELMLVMQLGGQLVNQLPAYLDLAFWASFLSFLLAAILPARLIADSIISVDTGTIGNLANAPVWRS